MQLVTNQKFIDNRVRFARWGTILGFMSLIGGFIISITHGAELFYYEYAALIFGFILFNVARYNSIRFEMKPTETDVLLNNLKGLDFKYRLYNYPPDIQVSHLLLSPWGMFVLETRHQWGEIRNNGSRWKHQKGIWETLRTIAVGSVGNPTRDALKGVQEVRRYLREQMGEEQASKIAVEGVVVFTSTRAHVTAEEPDVPVVSPKDLRAYVRSPLGREKLTPAMQQSLVEALAGLGAPSDR